jgi:hypothetical protein
MWLKCITCEVLARPIYYCAALSPHIIDVELVERGLHNRPDFLRGHLQSLLDKADARKYDAILFSYGLCGKATAGLTARSKPLVVPRAHDCITLFLGSRARYQHQFTEYPGTYWYAQDYIERDDGSGTALLAGLGSDMNIEDQYQEYVKKYGKDNADYLVEVMGAWQQHYQRAAYIDMAIGNGRNVELKAQEEASRRGWVYEKIEGSIILIRKLLEGDWDTDYLVIEPGKEIIMTNDDEIIGCVSND